MNDQQICVGCNLSNERFVPHGRYDDPFYGSYDYTNNKGLATVEIEILQHTKDIWDKFLKLEDKVFYDNQEMQDAIHRVQQLIALRVARRVDMMVWRQAEDAS